MPRGNFKMLIKSRIDFFGGQVLFSHLTTGLFCHVIHHQHIFTAHGDTGFRIYQDHFNKVNHLHGANLTCDAFSQSLVALTFPILDSLWLRPAHFQYSVLLEPLQARLSMYYSNTRSLFTADHDFSPTLAAWMIIDHPNQVRAFVGCIKCSYSTEL